MEKSDLIYDVLSSFFGLFHAYIDEYELRGKKVAGKIGCEDEAEKQDFSWTIELESSILVNIVILCNYLKSKKFVVGDKIIVDERELKEKLSELGWNHSEAQENIDHLCSIEMKMVDSGEETDSFFLHF